MFDPNNPAMGQMHMMALGGQQQMMPQNAQNIMGALQGFRDAREAWRGQRPDNPGAGGDMGAFRSSIQDWRQDRPMFGDYMHPAGNTGVVPPNMQHPINPMPPVAQPGGGMTGAPIQAPPMVGQSLNVQGMIPPVSGFGMPRY